LRLHPPSNGAACTVIGDAVATGTQHPAQLGGAPGQSPSGPCRGVRSSGAPGRNSQNVGLRVGHWQGDPLVAGLAASARVGAQPAGRAEQRSASARCPGRPAARRGFNPRPRVVAMGPRRSLRLHAIASRVATEPSKRSHTAVVLAHGFAHSKVRVWAGQARGADAFVCRCLLTTCARGELRSADGLQPRRTPWFAVL
jgi:hypothetical protein